MRGDGLDELRTRIDRLDETIVRALAARFALTRETGAYKGGALRDPAREAAVMRHVEALASEIGLGPAVVTAVYRLVLELSVDDQLATSSSVRN